MKLLNRQYISIIFIFLMILDSSIAFNKKYSRFKRSSNYLKKFYSTKTQLDRIETLNIKNPYFSFIVGFFESFGIQNINYTECLPEGWTKDIELEEVKIQTDDEVFNSVNEKSLFVKFIYFVGGYWDKFCGLRDNLIKLVALIYSTEDQIQEESFLEGKFLRNRDISWEWIKNKSAAFFDSIKSSLNSILEKIGETLKKLLEISLFDLFDIKKFMINLFGHEVVEKILSIIECVTTKPKLIIDNIRRKIKIGYNKINNLISVIKKESTRNIILVIADIVVGILCNYEELKVSIDYFKIASKERVPVNKWFFHGKGLGSLISSIANSNTFYENIKGQISMSSYDNLGTKPIYKVNIKNTVANFIIGVGDIMGNDETIWIDCLPCEWTESSDYNNDAQSPVEAHISKMSSLQKYLNYIGAIWPLICMAREPLVKIFEFILSKKENSTYFLEGKFTKKFVSKKGIFELLKNNIDLGFDKLENNLKSFIEKEPYMFKHFVDYIYNWFSDSFFEKIKKIVSCIYRIAKYSINIWKTFAIGIKKIQILIQNKNNFGYWADFLVAVLCNWTELKKSIDYFLYAQNLSDMNEKWYFYGRSVGSLITAISLAKPLSKPIIPKDNTLSNHQIIKTNPKNNISQSDQINSPDILKFDYYLYQHLLNNPMKYYSPYGYPSKWFIQSNMIKKKTLIDELVRK